MTKRKRKAKPVTATLSLETWLQLAADHNMMHRGWISAGYKLTPKSRLFRRVDGTWTARFVYAHPEPGLTATVVVRGLEVA